MALLALDNSLEANQRSRVIVEIDGKNVVLYIKLRWHVKTEKWMLSLFDEKGNPVPDVDCVRNRTGALAGIV